MRVEGNGYHSMFCSGSSDKYLGKSRSELGVDPFSQFVTAKSLKLLVCCVAQ